MQTDELLKTHIVRQMLVINIEQEKLINPLSRELFLEQTQIVSELANGLNSFASAVKHLKDAGVSEIDRESLCVFLDRLVKGIADESR